MLISQIDPAQLTQAQITRLIFSHIKDDDEIGDCILVFGSGSKQRVHKAVELYKAGRAPIILFSGGTRFGQFDKPEAITMAQQAVHLGVLESDILLETCANHTGENVLASLLVLDRAIGLHRIKRILAVSSPSHMLRCLLSLRTYMPRWIEFSSCPADRPYEREDNWWVADRERKWVLQEVNSLVKYVREGMILDMDISL